MWRSGRYRRWYNQLKKHANEEVVLRNSEYIIGDCDYTGDGKVKVVTVIMITLLNRMLLIYKKKKKMASTHTQYTLAVERILKNLLAFPCCILWPCRVNFNNCLFSVYFLVYTFYCNQAKLRCFLERFFFSLRMYPLRPLYISPC